MPRTDLTKERRRLQRLKWAMIVAALLLSVLYVVYSLVVNIPGRAILLDVALVAVSNFILVQVAFSIIFRLQERNAQQRERLTILHQVDVELGASLDRAQVLQAVLKGALRLVPGRTSRIFTYDPQRQEFTAGWECVASGTCYRTDHHPPPGGLTSRIVQSREPLYVEDAGVQPTLLSPEDMERGLKAAIGVPLLQGERVFGVLGVGFDSPQDLTHDQIETLSLLGSRVAVALDNARLYRDAVQEREVAHILLETAKTLSTTLRLDELLEHVLDALQQVVPYDAASINLLQGQFCWPAASRGLTGIPSQQFSLEKIPLVQRVVLERGPVTLSDVQDKSDALFAEARDPVRSWLGVPLISKDRVMGVLIVSSRYSDTYDEKTARLVLTFARQVALAIDNSRLYEQTRAQLRETTLLHNVMTALSSTLDVDQILPYVARSLCEILNGTSVEIYNLDEEDGTLTVITDYAAFGTSDLTRFSRVGQTYELVDLPAIAETLSRRSPVALQMDAAETSPGERAMLETRRAQASLLLPMVARDRLLGLVQIWDTRSPRRFTENEIAVAQTLIHPAATAMENARLFGEIQRRVRELRLLHDVALVAASGVRLEQTLEAVAEALVGALGDVRVSLLLLDSESDSLRLEASVGYSAEEVEEMGRRPDKGIADWVAEQGQPALVPDVRQDPRCLEPISDTRSVVCVPLATGPLVIGALRVESPLSDAFTSDDQRLLSTLASNLVMLIERIRLFEEVEAAGRELQQRAEALEEANARLQELDRLKTQFLASASHELRTPLNSIIGFSEVLMRGYMGEMPAEQMNCVESILNNGEHLLTLINDVLDLSKIEAGHLVLDPKRFDVTDLLEEVETTIKPMIDQKSQILTVEQADDLPLLMADRFRIRQVLLNLLSNANKFTPEGEDIILSCRLADPGTMLFSVVDNGVGIKPEDQEIIFEEFRQVGNASTQEAKGTGLGLTISKRLVELHGGRIWVESEYGHGATFSFSVFVDGPSAAGR